MEESVQYGTQSDTLQRLGMHEETARGGRGKETIPVWSWNDTEFFFLGCLHLSPEDVVLLDSLYAIYLNLCEET